MIKYHINKLIQIKTLEEDKFKNEIINISSQIIKDNNINLLKILEVYDEYKVIIKNMNDIKSEEIDYLNNEFDINIINIINGKIPISQNNKLLKENNVRI